MDEPIMTTLGDVDVVLIGMPGEKNERLGMYFPAPFELGGKSFANMAQYLVYAAATTCGDDATAMRVFAMDTPSYLTRLASQITPYDQERWEGVRVAVAKEALGTYFDTHPELASFLAATKDATLMYCGGADSDWSCGVSIDDPSAQVPFSWTGKNLWGRALMDVRPVVAEATKASDAELLGDKSTVSSTDAPPEAPAAPAEASEPAETSELTLHERKLAAIEDGGDVSSFMAALKDAEVIVPVEVLSAPDDLRQKLDTLTAGQSVALRDGVEIQPCILVRGETEHWIAAFSEISQIDQAALKNFSFVNLPMKTLAQMALSGESALTGVVLDAFTESMQIPQGVLAEFTR
ncbi:MAG: NADAR domain-containing protein [Atopobiaceae bacterium]|jgi:ribA/ribD-fused uncharacterized protein